MIPEPFDAYVVLALLAVTIAAFCSERWRPDIVSLVSMTTLLALGLLSGKDLVAVFGNEAPLTIAAMFILSTALERTGVVQHFGAMATRLAAGSAIKTLACVTIGSAGVSAFIANTPVVVVLTPVVIGLAKQIGKSASRFLIPLSYATVLGGGCTLIGTSTNIVASGAAAQSGLAPFSLFEITPLGVVMTVIGIAYMMVAAPRLLPDRETFTDMAGSARARRFLTELLVPLGSPLIGKTLGEADVARKLNVRVVDLIRDRVSCAAEIDGMDLRPGDRIVLRSEMTDVLSLRERGDVVFGSLGERAIEASGTHAIEPIASQNAKMVEAIVGPGSHYIGHRLGELNLRRQFGVYILAVHRRNENLGGNFDRLTLEFGDTLLIEGSAEGLARLFDQHELVAISEPAADARPRRGRAWIALGALAFVVVMSGFDFLPIGVLGLIAVSVVLVGGCLDADDAHGAIHWPILLLIFGSLGLGRAMETSGAAQLIVDGMMSLAHGMPPIVILALLYLIAMILTEFISNNASAILLVPIAIGIGKQLGVDPRPFVVAVMFASSMAFATPIGYQTNTFVYSAGGYKFIDFVKLGVPLNLLAWAVAVIMIPWIWPFVPRLGP